MYLQFIATFGFILLMVDLYFYRAMRVVIKGRERIKLVPKWFRISYWSFTVFCLLFLVFASYFYIAKEAPPRFARVYITGFIFITVVSKLIGVIFFLLDDIKLSIHFIVEKLRPKKVEIPGKKISRSTFIKQTGVVASALPFITMMYGVMKSAFDYHVIRIKYKSPYLPPAFHGFRVVQLSDIHSGSFLTTNPLQDAVKIVNEQHPDVVFFTGDLVNEIAEEALPFVDVLKGIKAPYGVHSILGNHDYGDYFYQSDDTQGKQHNYELIADVHRQMNWQLMRNEHRFLEKDGAKMGLIGVENWGESSRFQKYGDVEKAIQGMEKTDFNILLSHDPSHWNHIVSREYPFINLTLSGHTHGFQMGVEIPGYIKWSPAKYLYEQWAGLYERNGKHIYVNRGLGFLGYPGRLGILPEITVLELESTLV